MTQLNRHEANMLINFLCSKFDYLIHLGYDKKISEINNLETKLEYEKEVRIVFRENEMESFFIMEIYALKNNIMFRISDYYDKWYIIDCPYIDVFNFTKNVLKHEFTSTQRRLFYKSTSIFTGKKSTLAVIDLYKVLLDDCLENILNWMQE